MNTSPLDKLSELFSNTQKRLYLFIKNPEIENKEINNNLLNYSLLDFIISFATVFLVARFMKTLFPTFFENKSYAIHLILILWAIMFIVNALYLLLYYTFICYSEYL